MLLNQRDLQVKGNGRLSPEQYRPPVVAPPEIAAMQGGTGVASEEIMTSRIGVLALQGSFREHLTALRRLPGVVAVEVRTKEQLSSVDGLIIPGTF